MTISIQHLNSIVSSAQDINLYNYLYDDSISNQLELSIVELDNLEDSTGIFCTLSVEAFETTRGRVESFECYTLAAGEISIENTLLMLDTKAVFSPHAVINFRETVRYEVLDGSFHSFIDIPYEIMFLGQRLLSDSKTIVATTDLGMLITLEDSIAESILSDAIKAKNVGFKQLFVPVVGQGNEQLSISLVQYDIFNFKYDIRLVAEHNYIDYILLLSSIKRYMFFDETYPIAGEKQIYVQEAPETITLNGVRSSCMSLHFFIKKQDVYSELMSFRSKGEVLDFGLMPLISAPSWSYLEPLYSNELSMINVMRGSMADMNVPFLLSNTDKGYELTSNYTVHGSYPLYNAFNGNKQSPMIFTSYREGDIIVKLPEMQSLNSYSIGIGSYSNAHYDAPSGWTLSGSVDGKTFFDIETVDLGRQMNVNEVISRKVRQARVKFIKLYVHHIGRGYGYTRVGLLDFIFIDKSYEYTIRDFDPYYSLPWEPVIDIYRENDYVDLNEILYPIATWNDYKDFNGITKRIGDFRISGVETTSLVGVLMDYVHFSMQEIPDTVIDTEEYVSPYMLIQAGEKEDTSKDGIYKGIYLDTHRTMVNAKTPWLQKNGSIVKISDSKFYDMSFDNSKISIYKLSDYNTQVILLDWERISVSESYWGIPEYRMHPYIRIDSITGDFIIISLSVSGGSVTHLHRDGFINSYSYGQAYNIDDARLLAASSKEDVDNLVDPSKAEAYANVISSGPYRRSARIIKDTLDGLVYDQYIIDDARRLIERYEYCALFFTDLNCNPIVLNSIIKNKTRGMVSKDIFIHDGEFKYDDITFIHYIDDNIVDGDNVLSYVIDHKDVTISESKFILSTTFNNYTPGDMALKSIIDNCGAGSRCHNVLITGFNVINSIILTSITLAAADGTQWNITPDREDTYRGPLLAEYGAIDTYNSLFENFVEILMPGNLGTIVSSESRHLVTLGTRLEEISYPGRFTLGLRSFTGITSNRNSFVISIPSEVLEEVYADFEIKLHIDTRSDVFSPFLFGGGIITLDAEVIYLEDFFDKIPQIWLKMFFPLSAGVSSISAPIMDFNITERYFAKGFNIPYLYVDDPFTNPEYRTYKSGNGDVLEIKYKDFDDDPGKNVEKQSEKICGPERSITYLDFQAFDHKFSNTGDRLFGNYTWEIKELLMAGYIRISTNESIAPGKKITDADALERTLYEVRLSFIENLDDVADWHIEEFELTTEDFGLSASRSELLTGIDEQFRGLLKAVTATLGDDVVSYESREGANLFPAFPDRPPAENDFATIKVQQYFIVEEVEVVQN